MTDKNLFVSLVKLGMAQLGRGVVEVSQDYDVRPLAGPIAVLDCICGAENIIRGTILEVAEFDAKRLETEVDEVTLRALLFGSGKFSYANLPEELEKVTGYKLRNLSQYQDFGLLKNRLFRKVFKQEELTELTYRFGYEIIEPIANQFHGELILANTPGENKDEVHEIVHSYLEIFNINPEYLGDA